MPGRPLANRVRFSFRAVTTESERRFDGRAPTPRRPGCTVFRSGGDGLYRSKPDVESRENIKAARRRELVAPVSRLDRVFSLSLTISKEAGEFWPHQRVCSNPAV